MKERVNKKILALYYRESTREQALNGFNLEDQRKKIEYYVEINKIPGRVMHFCEAGASASSLNRPEMNKLIDLVKNNKVGIIVIHNLDRLTRRIKDLIQLLELFEKHNVELIACTENIDTATATGRFFIYMISLIAQWEEDTISERSRRGVLESAKQGNYVRGGKVPFGFDRVEKDMGNNKNIKTLVPNEKERAGVELVFKQISYGESAQQVTEMLRRLYPERRWAKNMVIRMVRNPIYNGMFFVGDDTFYLDSKMIDDGTYKMANEMIDYHQKPKKYNYLFKGRLKCETCGKYLGAESSVTKSVQLYYSCKCCRFRINEKRVREQLLESFAVNLPSVKVDKAIDNIKIKMNRTKRLQEKLINSVGSSKDISTFASELEALNKQIVFYAKKIQDLRKHQDQTMKIYMSSFTNEDILKIMNERVQEILVKEDGTLKIVYRDVPSIPNSNLKKN